MSEEQVEEWLKNEYGMTYKELQRCHDFRCDEVLKQDKEIGSLQQEIKELNDDIIWWTNRFNAVERDNREYRAKIDKAIEYITKQMKKYEGYDRDFEIVLSNIVVMLGSDKE